MRVRFSSIGLWRSSSAAQRAVLAGAVLLVVALIGVVHYSAKAASSDTKESTRPNAGGGPARGSNTDALELTDAQLGEISLGTVSERSFPIQTEAVGNIDFNQDMAAQVFPPYQGRIAKLFAVLGENVKRGQPLLTIESPDLIQAESILIATAGVLDLTTRALDRARQLSAVQGIADKDLQQAASDQQTAEGALKAARDAVAVFGKSPSEVDRMVQTRTIDPYLVVPSPITGRVTARNAAPGDFVLPGTIPAPYSVADISRIWMNASVTESDMPRVRKGQTIHVSVMAFPGRVFDGEIAMIGASVDPVLHRGMVRAEIEDPQHELLPGMFASFVIVTGAPVSGVAVPVDGVVREGDGTMTVWLATDAHHFTKKAVKVGLQSAGYDQILEGVGSGAQVVTKGAVYLDVMASGES